MIRRRLAFAAPFVIVACGAKKPVVDDPEEDTDETEEAPRAAPEPTPILQRIEVPERRWPAELVDELEPLTGEMTIEDVCRRVRCNPPPPYKKQKPAPLEPVVRTVKALKREDGGGTRVRIPNVRLWDRRWRITFVTNKDNPTDLANGDCTTVAHDYHEIECVTSLEAEELAVEGHARPVRLVPPAALVRQIESEIASWSDGTRARVINIAVAGSDVDLVINAGRDEGVDKDSIVTIAKTPCKILDVRPRVTRCRAQLTPSQVHADPFVTISRTD